MFRGLRVCLLLTAVTTVLAGCAAVGQGGWKADTDTIWLSEMDDGMTVHMELGQSLVVSLRQVPDECYEWGIEDIDEAVLKFDRVNVLSDHPGVPCSGADMIFHFDAASGGNAHLRLSYASGWMESEKTFEVWVVVR